MFLKCYEIHIPVIFVTILMFGRKVDFESWENEIFCLSWKVIQILISSSNRPSTSWICSQFHFSWHFVSYITISIPILTNSYSCFVQMSCFLEQGKWISKRQFVPDAVGTVATWCNASLLLVLAVGLSAVLHSHWLRTSSSLHTAIPELQKLLETTYPSGHSN